VEPSLTRKQHLAILQALEASFEGTLQHSVAAHLRNADEYLQQQELERGEGHHLSPTNNAMKVKLGRKEKQTKAIKLFRQPMINFARAERQ